ncbi:MAG: AAA family ATPase [Actinomycetota bacterium]|nr:AAA family ATPase [Actinomycetota bacterium]
MLTLQERRANSNGAHPPRQHTGGEGLQPGGPEHAATLRDYLKIARRRKWIILGALILVPLTAVALSLRQEHLFRADAEVLLGQQNLANALTGTVDPSVYLQPDRRIQTQADLARVPEVASRALAATGLPGSAADFLASSSVSAKQNSDLLDFAVTNRDPALASKLATTYASAFVAYRQQLDTASLQRARNEVQHKLDQLGEQHGSLYQSLIEKDQQLATMEALQTSNASLVKPAFNAAQVQPRPMRNGALGVVLGLALGIGLAFLWEALDTRVRDADEIAERLGLPLLSRLLDPGRRLRREGRLVMLAEPHGAGGEAFRMLRTNLEFVRVGHDVKTIMVTSAVEREGKSTTVANLAVALTHAGHRVALVDLDLRRPSLRQFFDLDDEQPGLAQVVLGQASLSDALAPVSVRDVVKVPFGAATAENENGAVPTRQVPSGQNGSLRVLTTGPLPPNPGELAGSEALAAIIEELRAHFDVVLLDTPPLLQVGDAMALSRSVDGVVIVTRTKVVRRPMLNELRRLLEVSPALPLGFVVTEAESEDGYGYGYAGSYYGARSPAEAVAR